MVELFHVLFKTRQVCEGFTILIRAQDTAGTIYLWSILLDHEQGMANSNLSEFLLFQSIAMKQAMKLDSDIYGPHFTLQI